MAIFADSEEDAKRKILMNVDLAGESTEELLAGDDESSVQSSKNVVKRLPSTFPRDVVYNEKILAMVNAYYNHDLATDEARKKYYDEAVSEANQAKSEYEKFVNLARAEYFYGVSYLAEFDLTQINDINLSDGNSSMKTVADAGAYLDKAIEYAEAALKIKAGSDAYNILSQTISANCTAKNVTYILGNALKVRAYAKKAVKADYSNGCAHFFVAAQDIYAPWPFAKIKTGRKNLNSLLNNKYIRLENQDRLLIFSAMGYSYLRQKKWAKAIEWYNKGLEIYPENASAKLMIQKAKDKK